MTAHEWWIWGAGVFAGTIATIAILWVIAAVFDPRAAQEKETPDPKAGGHTHNKEHTPWTPTDC